MRSEGGQRKYNAMLASRQKEARDRSLYVNGSLAIVVVLVSIIGIGVQGGRAKIKGSLTATNASATNGVVYGKKAAATVDVFEDYMCPICGAFEQSVGKTLEADVIANRAQVRYHSISILDSLSNGTHYSSRAANAALCASDVSVDMFVKFHDILFSAATQPKENSDGLTDGRFLQIAQQAGMATTATGTFTTCVQSQEHKALVAALTENASKRGVTGTPTVLVNGKKVSADLASLNKAIAAADAKGPAPAPSPTPTPTPSTSVSGSTTKTATPSGTATTKG
jgi:protein-disulfide isomerase